jgi:hypothetical protein
MRDYWIRIALGAVAIFVVGMIGVTLVRRGVSGVREVAEGTGPITLPIMFVPFKLDGQRLGTIHRVVVHRDAPKRVSSVQLEVKLSDSVLARGLEGCRLLANFDEQHGSGKVEVEAGSISRGVFSCLHGDTVPPRFQDFGHAVFQPGDVSVPLLLPEDIVKDLRENDLESVDADSIEAQTEAMAESIAAEAEARADSISSIAEVRADSIMRRNERLVDSLRREGMRRADSARQSPARVADSAPRR